MTYRSRSIATAVAATIALASGSMTLSAQVTVDLENRYSNVGAIMVWRVDDAGKPVQLLGFASGTLIRDRMMVTAGHVTAPAGALGSIPPSIRIFASFSANDAKDPKSWIPVLGVATHPSMPRCQTASQCNPTEELLVAPLEPGIADFGLVFLAHAPPGIKPARLAKPGSSKDPKEPIRLSWGTARRLHETIRHRRTRRCGTASGASGLPRCEESSMRRGVSDPYRVTFAPAIPAAPSF